MRRNVFPLELRAGLIEGQLTPAAARLELMSTANDDYRKALAQEARAAQERRAHTALRGGQTPGVLRLHHSP